MDIRCLSLRHKAVARQPSCELSTRVSSRIARISVTTFSGEVLPILVADSFSLSLAVTVVGTTLC